MRPLCVRSPVPAPITARIIVTAPSRSAVRTFYTKVRRVFEKITFRGVGVAGLQCQTGNFSCAFFSWFITRVMQWVFFFAPVWWEKCVGAPGSGWGFFFAWDASRVDLKVIRIQCGGYFYERKSKHGQSKSVALGNMAVVGRALPEVFRSTTKPWLYSRVS